MHLELVSFKLCPFVQRSVITFLHKEVSYRIRYIDLAAPPHWFSDLSPEGKVPVLVVNDQHVLFESSVINEFVDEITPGRLLPVGPLQRAMSRSWIAFGSKCLWATREMTTAEDETAFRQVVNALQEKLSQLESILGPGPYFDASGFSLVDCAYAPLFMRLELIGDMVSGWDFSRTPKVAAWSSALLALPEVTNSVTNDFKELFTDLVHRRGGYLASRLPGGPEIKYKSSY